MGIMCSKKKAVPPAVHPRRLSSISKPRRRREPAGGAGTASLLDLAVDAACASLARLPRDALRALPPDCCQLLLERLVDSGRLDDDAAAALAGLHFHALDFGRCPGLLRAAWLHGLCSPSLERAVLDRCQLGGEALLGLGPLPALHTLHLEYCTDLTDASLAALRGLPALRDLSLAGCEALSPAALRWVGAAGGLVRLNLQTCHRLSGLHHLRGLRRLRHLDLGWCRGVGDADAAALAEFSSLESLNVSGTRVGDAGLAPLAALQALSELGLGTLHAASDAGIAQLLGALPALRAVSLARSAAAGGATLRALAASSPGLRELWLGYTGVKDSDLPKLAGLPRLALLSLEACEATDRGLEVLTSLQELDTLDLSDTEAGNGAMAAVAGLPRLRSLNLAFTRVDNKGLKRLGAGAARLRRLNLDSRYFTDAGMEHVARLPELEVLDLFGARVTDASMVHICKLSKLRSLEICGGGIGDAGVARLTCGLAASLERLSLAHNFRISNASVASLMRLTRLRELNLSQSRVTGSAVVALGCLSSLETLVLAGTRVRPAAVEKLNQINPGLEVLGVPGCDGLLTS